MTTPVNSLVHPREALDSGQGCGGFVVYPGNRRRHYTHTYTLIDMQRRLRITGGFVESGGKPENPKETGM